MKKIILVLIFLFWFFNNSYADDMVASWLSTKSFHFVKWDLLHEQKFYIISNINWNNNPIVSVTNSWYTRIQNSWTIWVKNSWHELILNSIDIWVRLKFDRYDGNETIYVFWYTVATSWAHDNIYILLINNITWEYYNFFLNNTDFWYWTNPFRTNFRFISLDDKLIFYTVWWKYFWVKVFNWLPVINISTSNEPWFINPVTIPIVGQFVRWEWWNRIRTCSLGNASYNYYAWSSLWATSNHSSIEIPQAFTKSYTSGGACVLYYLPLNNVTFFTQFNNNQSFSSFYIPWQWFSTDNIEFGYYIYSHDIYNDTYAYVNLANNPRVFRSILPNPWIAPFAAQTLSWSSNPPYMIYQLSAEPTNFYSTANIVNNNLNTPTLSGTTITGNQNNSIVNNNNNNINLNPTITNTVNIPGVCPFGKKLSPIRWTDWLYYCQVDEWYSCPYGNATPVFFLEWFFCEIPKQESDWNAWTGALIPDYSNILNNSWSANNSSFGSGSIESIIWGWLSIGSSSWIAWLFNNTIVWSSIKTNNCTNIISWWIFQYSIWKNTDFFQIKLENVDTEKMLWEANGWKLEFFWVNFLKPLYSILDFFGNFSIKIYNYTAGSIEWIIDIFWYIFNSIQRNKYYCFLWEEYYIFAQSTQYKSLLDNTMKTNNWLIDIIVIIWVIITNLILLIKLKKW